MKHIKILPLLLLAIQIVSAQTIEWRNDRTGIYQDTGLLPSWPANGPELLWHFNGLGQGYSSVAVADGKLYVTGMTDGTGYLYVLDRQGKLLNKTAYGKEWHTSYQGARGTVIPNDGRLYVVSGTGILTCFDASDLKILWQKNAIDDFGGEIPKYGMNESPLIVGDKLIFTPGGKEHNIVALNKKSGELIWSSKAMGDIPSYCCPVYIGDQATPQVATMTGHHIVGIDISDGRLLWSVPFTNRFFEHPNTPLYENGLLLCSSSYGVGTVMLRLTDGGKNVEEVWRIPDFDSRTGHTVKQEAYIYGAGDYGKGSWCCVEWKTGKTLYKDKTLPAGAIITADGMLYCYTEKGDMALVRATPEKFDIVSKFPVTLGTEQHWAHPVIYKGVLYIRHGDTLMAYKIIP